MHVAIRQQKPSHLNGNTPTAINYNRDYLTLKTRKHRKLIINYGVNNCILGLF